MKKLGRVLLFAAIPLLLIVVSVVFALRSSSDTALQRYKDELRAKGEKLTWSELGFPRPPVTNTTVAELTNAVGRIGKVVFAPSDIRFLHFTGPGRVTAVDSRLEFVPPRAAARTLIDWNTVQAHLAAAEETLEEIRRCLENPSPYALVSESNLFGNLRFPFVPQRTAAYWLAADAVGALRRQESERALRNVHALSQLARLHSEDLLLVTQMVRTAIAGLGLSVTWQVLHSDDLTELQLAKLQRDWESLDYIDCLEKGMTGERAFGQSAMELVRNEGVDSLAKWSGHSGSFTESLQELATHALTHMDLDGNELLLLEHNQAIIESVRRLKHGAAWNTVRGEIAARNRIINSKATGIAKYRYALALIVTPHIEKAAQTVVRNETFRRLTVTAIALKRFQLRNGSFPSSLTELAPDFLAAVPIDPMSGDPLRYRLNDDGSFALWSVGEDGKDDGGDPNPAMPVKEFDLWSGRDAVWPLPDRGE